MTIAFKANKNGTNQTSITANTLTQLTFSNELYDLGGYFATNAWTPPAGYISMVCNIGYGGTIAAGTDCHGYIYKNGSAIAQVFQYAASSTALTSFAFDDICNGSDVYTVWGSIISGSGLLFFGNPEFTNFSGVWISA